MHENTRIENKLKLNRDYDLEKEVVAFLNFNGGGSIFFGVDKNGVTVGIENTDQTILEIKDRLKARIIPSCMGLFDITAIQRDNKEIIHVTISSGSEKPYYIKKYGLSEKGAFIRNGTAADPMPSRMIENLFSKRVRNSLRKIEAKNQNLTFSQLKIFYEAKGIDLNKNFANNLELLTEKGKFNYVGYLMCDENTTSVKLAKYIGNSRVNFDQIYEVGRESLIKATNAILERFELENTVKSRLVKNKLTEEFRWDSVALREAIINAFVHNDYTTELAPKFEIFDDRIEITSNGGLPHGLEEFEFFEGFSIPRNKELVRIYKDLNFVEQLGSGVPRILQSYNKDCFKFFENFVRMTFPCKIYENDQVDDQVNDHVNDQVDITSDERKELEVLAKSLNQLQLSILEYVSTPKSNTEIQTEHLKLKKHNDNFKRYIGPLLENGLIERTIPEIPKSRLQKYLTTKDGRYILQLLKK